MTLNHEFQFACSNADRLKKYLQDKARNHNHYKYYSTLKRVTDIRDCQALYLVNGRMWNDVTDRLQFNRDEYDCVHFAKSFSFSRDESVAMWMLYGGVDKCGGMIDFTKKGIHSILDTQEIELGYFDDQGKFVSCAALMRTEFDIWITDIVYYSENKRYFCLKRSDESCYTVSKSVMDGLIMCKKAYPWNYENECRLIVSISRQILQQIYNFGDCDTVKLNLQGMNLGKSFKRIYKSPNYPLNDNTGVLASNIDQTVDWNICKDHCRLSGGE